MKYRLILMTLSAVLLFSSCPLGTSFSDLEGINLLSTDEQAFTGWVIDYGKTVSYDYLTFENSAEVGPAGAPSVHRMEIVNLVPNGDFFDGSTLADWVSVGGATHNIIGGELTYGLAGATEMIDFELSGIMADFLISEGTYLIRFDFKSSSPGTSYFEYRDPSSPWALTINDETQYYSFPRDFSAISDGTFIPDGTNDYFTIGTTGSGGAMSGSLDNFRIARTDITSCIVIDVPVTSANRPDLISGYYRFTIQIKNDPGVTPITPNRMPATSICLGLSSAEGASTTSVNVVSQSALPSWSNWTTYSVTGHIQIDEGAETALRLRISPTDTLRGSYGRDVGSLLISAPILEYSSSGSF